MSFSSFSFQIPSLPPRWAWLRPLALVTLSFLAALAVTSCGGASAGIDSTDTGNPPVVDAQKIQVTPAGTGVSISGAAGTVNPAGAKVTVENLTTGDSVETTANADGSFEAEISGATDGQYRLVVEADGKSTQLEINDGQVSDGRQGGDSTMDLSCSKDSGQEPATYSTNGPQPVCGELYTEATCRARTAEDEADKACNADSDCVMVNTAPSCADSCGFDAAASQDGAAALEAAIATIDDDVCARFDAQGCNFIAVPCDPTIEVPRCVAGSCTLVEDVPPSSGDTCDPHVGCEGANFACIANSCDEMGTCMEFGPIACPAIYAPVCGCDGMTYGNSCGLAGAPYASEGECP